MLWVEILDEFDASLRRLFTFLTETRITGAAIAENALKAETRAKAAAAAAAVPGGGAASDGNEATTSPLPPTPTPAPPTTWEVYKPLLKNPNQQAVMVRYSAHPSTHLCMLARTLMEQSCRFPTSVLSRWPHAGSSFAGLRCVLVQVCCALVQGCERCYLLLPSIQKLTKSIQYNLRRTAPHCTVPKGYELCHLLVVLRADGHLPNTRGTDAWRGWCVSTFVC